MAETQGRLQPQVFAWFTLAAVIVYVAVDVLLRFLRPQYSLIYNVESDYGRGPWFWVMDLNFLLRCALSLTLVVAIARKVHPEPRLRYGLTLLVVWGVTSGLLAFFADDIEGQPVHGSGVVHLLLAFVAFVCIAIGAIRVSISVRDVPSWAAIGRVLVVLSVLAAVPLLLLVALYGKHRPDGLFERMFLGTELLWMSVTAGVIATKGPARNGLARS